MSDVLKYACRLLARREYSVAELRGRLEAKFPASEDIRPAVEQLVAENLVCDRRYAQAFVRARVARFQGPRKIRAELFRRSVPESQIEAALEQAGRAWTDLASDWLGRQGQGTEDYQTRAKYYRRLVNRGFTHDQAMDALAAWVPERSGVSNHSGL